MSQTDYDNLRRTLDQAGKRYANTKSNSAAETGRQSSGFSTSSSSAKLRRQRRRQLRHPGLQRKKSPKILTEVKQSYRPHGDGYTGRSCRGGAGGKGLDLEVSGC
jgi:hypothetical protein